MTATLRRPHKIKKPTDGTTFHVGYARYFTPPVQVIAAPVNLALVTPPTAPANTQTPAVPVNDPVLPLKFASPP